MDNIRELIEIFSSRLKDLMFEKGLNIKALSNATKIPFTTIDAWILKKSSPKIDNLCAIAEFFNVTTDYLLGREN